MRFCLTCTWRQAIYGMTCSLTVQHIFWALKVILRLFVGARIFALDFILMIIIYSILYQFFAYRLFPNMFYNLEWKDLSTAIIILLFVFGVSTQYGNLETNSIPTLAYLLADANSCFLVIWLQASKQAYYMLLKENSELEVMLNQQKTQYEMTKNMIDLINQRCHDIKHQIHAASNQSNDEVIREYLDTLADNVMVYDMAIHTGNKALDTVLMEKGLLCKGKGIQWVCMANGSMVDFIKPADIYAIFGNLIDNAIEAIEKLSDSEKRILHVRIVSQESLLTIQVENMYEGKIVFRNNLPVTTKEDPSQHGFGVRSVDYIVKSYDGTFTVKAEREVFQARIMIPVKKHHM